MADVNSVTAIVKDGKIENASNKTESKDKNTQAKGYDKDSFLKILVAQMKYQDPMEPTSNTEYISQYATFTQVEQMNNMANAMSLSRASEMVGKTVTITQTNPETGTKSEVQGVVDFVTYSGNKAFLNINGTNYNVDDVTQVLGAEYASAYKEASEFVEKIDKLPNLLEIDSLGEYGDQIWALDEAYKGFGKKTTNLIDKDYETSLKQYVKRIEELESVMEGFLDEIGDLPANLDEITIDAHGKKIDSLYEQYMNIDRKTINYIDPEGAYSAGLLNYVNKIDDLRGNAHRTFSKKAEDAQEV